MYPWPVFPVSCVTAHIWVLKTVSKQAVPNIHTPFPKPRIQQLPVYLKYLQYPRKPGKCLPHFPFDCSAIRGQGFTYTWHERCLPFTLALGNLPLTGAYHRRSTPYRIRCQQCDSPRQRQHILSVLGLYPTSKYPYNLLQQ